MRYLLICLLFIGCNKSSGNKSKDEAAKQEAAKNPYTIYGTVLGAKIVKIVIDGPINRTTNTGADNTYRFNRVPNGVYIVTPSLFGYTFLPQNTRVDRYSHIANFVGTPVLPPEPPQPPINEAPETPTGLWAFAGDSIVTLKWDANTETDLVGYVIYRAPITGIYENIATVTVTQYIDKGVVNGLTYLYVITAKDIEKLESIPTIPVSALPLAPPLPPTYVCKIAWSAPTKNTSGENLTDLAGYRLYKGLITHNYPIVIQLGNITEYDFRDIAGTYYLAVTAFDTSGNESTYSNEIVVTLP